MQRRRVRVWPARSAWHYWEECTVSGALVQGCTAGQTHFNMIGWVLSWTPFFNLIGWFKASSQHQNMKHNPFFSVQVFQFFGAIWLFLLVCGPFPCGIPTRLLLFCNCLGSWWMIWPCVLINNGRKVCTASLPVPSAAAAVTTAPTCTFNSTLYSFICGSWLCSNGHTNRVWPCETSYGTV